MPVKGCASFCVGRAAMGHGQTADRRGGQTADSVDDVATTNGDRGQQRLALLPFFAIT